MGLPAAIEGDRTPRQDTDHRRVRASPRRSSGRPADGCFGHPSQTVQLARSHRSHRASPSVTESRRIGNRIAARFRSRFLQGYIRSKVQMDPLYEFVFSSVKDTSQPLLDIGCGVGIMSFYLRERGLTLPTLGVDTDAMKIAHAQEAARVDRQVEFRVGDAREALDGRRSVLLLDVLHYLTDDEQRGLLRRVA